MKLQDLLVEGIIGMNFTQSLDKPSHLAHHTHRHLLVQRHISPDASFYSACWILFNISLLAKYYTFFRLEATREIQTTETRTPGINSTSFLRGKELPVVCSALHPQWSFTQRWLCLRNKYWSFCIKEMGGKKPLCSVLY